MATSLIEMQNLGQSPWHDNIRRELLTSGKLQKMIEAGDITGLTSNPTIFEHAIQSGDYNKEIDQLGKAGKSAEEIFDAIAIEDIRAAADLFRPVYERTGGNDGYVSIEVAPKFARQTEATIAEARRLWGAVDRPNLLVKIPATVEGLPAIEESIAAGINVNVTLIFALKRYDAVMDAYIHGLTRRLSAGQDLTQTFSVASFFVSRVDTLVDKLLTEKNAPEAQMGKAAIANAKLAYRDFKRRFHGAAFAELKGKGARAQRPLWASTSTKNPRYPDTYYVEALLGPQSVDTMPPATIDAFRDHGKAQSRLEQGVAEAEAELKGLAGLGIDMDQVTRQLEDEGVASFAKSFDSLIATVEQRRKEVLG